MKSLPFALLMLWSLLVTACPLWADPWPQWLGPQRDGVWREVGIVEKFTADGPPVRWRRQLGAGYTGPAVAEGRVYVMDRHLATAEQKPASAFDRGRIAGFERVICLDEKDGTPVWEHAYSADYTMSYPAGPRATPTVSDGKVYTLGAEGHLLCLDASSGVVAWSRELSREFDTRTPMWGYAAHPLVDGQKLICLVGGKGSVVVAFDKETGEELWRSLSAKEPGYSPPMIYEAGGKRQLIVWHPEAVNGLDPETGQVFWTEPWEARAGLSISTPRKLGHRLFLTSFYNGSLLLRFESDRPSVTELWRSRKPSEKDTTELHSIISTPFLEQGYAYGICSYGQLRCVNLENGERVWETLAATTRDGREVRWGNAFLVKQDDRFFLFNELGELIIAKLTPSGYTEISRAQLLEPTNTDPARPVVWSHPAYANRSVYARNDQEIVCASLAAP